MGSLANFLSIAIFTSLYNHFAKRLNDWVRRPRGPDVFDSRHLCEPDRLERGVLCIQENWMTNIEWEDAFVKKLFGFQFVNNFFFLFFIAYFKYVEIFGTVGGCKFDEIEGRDSCMQELE